MKINVSIDTDKITIADNKVIVDIDPAKDSWFDSVLKAKNSVMLSDLNPKDEFKIGNEVFIVLEQTDNGTRVISKEFAYDDVKFGDNSDWKVSPIRKILHNDYFKKIADIIGEENILHIHRDLTSLDGLDDYGVCTDRVSLLTAAEYAKYHKILGLKPNDSDWWWLITPASTPSNDYSRGVCYVDSYGILSWFGCGFDGGVRPFLNLSPSTQVISKPVKENIPHFII